MNIIFVLGFVLLGAAIERIAKGLYLMWWRRRQRRLRRSGVSVGLIDRLNRDSSNPNAKSNVRIPVQRDRKDLHACPSCNRIVCGFRIKQLDGNYRAVCACGRVQDLRPPPTPMPGLPRGGTEKP